MNTHARRIWSAVESPVLPLPPGFKQRVRNLRRSLSGYHATVADLLADGDKVIARWVPKRNDDARPYARVIAFIRKTAVPR